MNPRAPLLAWLITAAVCAPVWLMARSPDAAGPGQGASDLASPADSTSRASPDTSAPVDLDALLGVARAHPSDVRALRAYLIPAAAQLRILVDQGRARDAVALADTMDSVKPYLETTLYLRGLANIQLKKWTDAESDLLLAREKCRAKRKGNTGLDLALARVAIALRAWDLAVRSFQDYRDHGGNPDALTLDQIINVQTHAHLLGKAIASMEESWARFPAHRTRPSDEALFKRYGPKVAMTHAQIDALLKDISWDSNDNAKGIGSPDAVKGGAIRIEEHQAPATLRCFGKNSGTLFAEQVQALLCFESLLGLHPVTLEYVPKLSNRWSMARDMETFYFRLDPRSRFSDGSPVTSFDVVATWDLMVDPGIEDDETHRIWSKFDRPEALTRDIVRVHAHEVNWRLFMTFATTLLVYPQCVLAQITGAQYIRDLNDWLLPGSGPYELSSAQFSTGLELKRRPDWWAKDLPMNRGLANFDTIELAFDDRPYVARQKLMSGAIDVDAGNLPWRWTPGQVPQDQVPEELRKGWLLDRKIYNSRCRANWLLEYNDDKWPLDDLRVRQALSDLFDRDAAMRQFIPAGYEFTDSMWPGSAEEYRGNPKVRYDYPKAVALLEQAGWLQKNRDADGWLVKDGKRFEITLISITPPDEDGLLTMYRNDLGAAGIKLDLKCVTWAEQIKRRSANDFLIMDSTFSGEIFPDPEPFAPRMDRLKNRFPHALLEKEKVTFDRKKRVKIMRQIDAVVCGLSLYSFLFSKPYQGFAYWNKFGMPETVLPRFGDEYSPLLYWWEDPVKKTQLEDAMRTGRSLPIPAGVVKGWAQDRPEDAGE